jgi:hypothetical protein
VRKRATWLHLSSAEQCDSGADIAGAVRFSQATSFCASRRQRHRGSAAGAMGVMSQLKARLGEERFRLLQAVSLGYQRSECGAVEYYDVALDVLQGRCLHSFPFPLSLPCPFPLKLS